VFENPSALIPTSTHLYVGVGNVECFHHESPPNF
jgi:hypothetical protein